MSALANDLLDLERQFWSGGAEFYRRNLDESCAARGKCQHRLHQARWRVEDAFHQQTPTDAPH